MSKSTTRRERQRGREWATPSRCGFTRKVVHQLANISCQPVNLEKKHQEYKCFTPFRYPEASHEQAWLTRNDRIKIDNNIIVGRLRDRNQPVRNQIHRLSIDNSEKRSWHNIALNARKLAQHRKSYQRSLMIEFSKTLIEGRKCFVCTQSQS